MASTVPESINGGHNCKTNQKARYWADAAFFVGEGEEEMLWKGSQSCAYCVERVHVANVKSR